MRVGFIGIGRMGSAIAGRVLDGGNELTVWNRTPEKTAELAAARRPGGCRPSPRPARAPMPC